MSAVIPTRFCTMFSKEKVNVLKVKDPACLSLELSTMATTTKVTTSVPVNGSGSGTNTVKGSWIGLVRDVKLVGHLKSVCMCMFRRGKKLTAVTQMVTYS